MLSAILNLLMADLAAQNIFNDLSRQKEGEGKVTVQQSSAISSLLNQKKEAWSNKKRLTYVGYRVQVYMGNRNQISQNDATARQNSIKNQFPNVKTYLTFSSPFWKLRAGDFRTHADALVLANSLKRAFPKWSGDIYVVKDNEVFDPDFESAAN